MQHDAGVEKVQTLYNVLPIKARANLVETVVEESAKTKAGRAVR